jgi:(R,R)-butanediol dehydrogenase/meso-butanediol dehydrogenase/diacetyl reductase
LSDVQAAQVEPATVTFHAVRRSGVRLGDRVVIQGAGPIGLGTLQWVKAAGAGTIVVVEPNQRRRELAVELGAHHTITPGEEADSLVQELTYGLGADIVYECVGKPQAIQSAVDLARRGGSMCLIGLADTNASISPASWLIKEISVTSALAYTHEEFELAMTMMADGRFRTEPMHSGTMDLSSVADVLDDLASGTSIHTKVLIDPHR